MAEHVQQRPCEGHSNDKCQTMVTDAKRANLLLPLLKRARFADRRKLGTGLVEVQVLAVRAYLLLGQ